MELSPEAYRTIVKYVGNRTDIAALCRVSKNFQYAAERALYNTLFMQHVGTTMLLCETLANQSRVASLVDALTISLSEAASDDDDVDDDEMDEEMVPEGETSGDNDTTEPLAVVAQPALVSASLPEGYWTAVSRALRNTTQLRYLNIHVSSPIDTSVTWILDRCTFQLRSLHCDLDWGASLVAFLNSQSVLNDLYILDYNEGNMETPMPATQKDLTPPTTAQSPSSSPTSSAAAPPPESPLSPSFGPSTTSTAVTLDPSSLPRLSTLECTYTEAAAAIVPGRPITRLKTCFSRTEFNQKREELRILVDKIKLSTRRFRSLDLADSDYTESFSIELLQALVPIRRMTSEMRYLGTVGLPVAGRERLRFYGLLRRFPRLQAIEVEVSHWNPPPESLLALRALSGELRLYAPSIATIVFVREFDRTVVTYVDGICRLDNDLNPELLWREI